VAVRDEGPGIADEDRDRIFERFHRGSGQLSQGSGLGLTIARQIVESHQGRLVLTQRSGPGSTFVIWLPERAVTGAPERSFEPPDCDPLGRSAAETLVH
jgi:signal transduction histidine kinase